MKNLILFFAFIVLCFAVSAQKQYIDNSKSYQKAKIYQKNKSEVLKVSNLKIQNDTLVLFNDGLTGSSIQKQLNSSSIRYIAIQNGTYAGRYAIAGGGIGLLSALYGVLSVKSDPTLDDSEVNWAPFVFGFTAGGAVLGGLIGLAKPKWQILYLKDNKTSFHFDLSPNFSKSYCGISVKVNF